MTKTLKFSVIWFIVLVTLFIPFMIASNRYQKWINMVEDELFAIYQDYMPLSSASTESIGAYTFYEKKGEIESKVDGNFRLFFAEAASKNAESARKFMPFFGTASFILVGMGVILLLVYLILGVVKSIKTKRIDFKYFKPSLVFFSGITLVIGTFSYQSSLENKRIFSTSNKLYDIGQYASNIVDKFVEQSNLFYEISVIEQTQDQDGWLSKMVLAKKKNESLLNELEAIKKWDIPKDSHYPRYEDLITPSIEMCKRLKKYFELSTATAPNIAQQNMSRAEGYAEFSELLEKLSDVLKGVVKYSGVSMKYIFEYNHFDKDALAKFQSMDNDPPDTKYNVKLIFGHVVYREIKKKAQAEETYAKRTELLKKK